MAEAPGIDIADIMARLEAAEAKAEAAAQRAIAAESRLPTFTPIRQERRAPVGGYVPPEELRKQDTKGLQRDGDMAHRQLSAYDNPKQWENVPVQYRPVFSAGQPVRLNPAALVHGDKAKTWGSIVSDDGTPVTELEGEVIATFGRTKTWEPKYRVRIPGLTRSQGMGIRESELIPA